MQGFLCCWHSQDILRYLILHDIHTISTTYLNHQDHPANLVSLICYLYVAPVCCRPRLRAWRQSLLRRLERFRWSKSQRLRREHARVLLNWTTARRSSSVVAQHLQELYAHGLLVLQKFRSIHTIMILMATWRRKRRSRLRWKMKMRKERISQEASMEWKVFRWPRCHVCWVCRDENLITHGRCDENPMVLGFDIHWDILRCWYVQHCAAHVMHWKASQRVKLQTV